LLERIVSRVLRQHFFQRASQLVAGVVDQHVKAAAAGENGFDARTNGLISVHVQERHFHSW
jgi:hypothetical protein